MKSKIYRFVNMATYKRLLLSIVLIFIVGTFSTSCKKNDYPCPGLGQSNEADLSMFTEDGQLKSKHKNKGRIDKSTGLVRKKNPKQIRARRKTRL